jgi:hypothetical protein
MCLAVPWKLFREPLNDPVKLPLNDPVNEPVENELLKAVYEEDNIAIELLNEAVAAFS